MTNQDQLLQIRVNQSLKNKIKTAALLKGMPMSTYIKMVIGEHIKKEEALENLNLSFSKTKLAHEILRDLKYAPQEKVSFKQALQIITRAQNNL